MDLVRIEEEGLVVLDPDDVRGCAGLSAHDSKALGEGEGFPQQRDVSGGEAVGAIQNKISCQAKQREIFLSQR